MGQIWPACDPEIQDFIQSFVGLVTDTLASEVRGIYLHGSLATGSYYPPKSDMDLLAVVETGLNAAVARELNQKIARLAETRPTVGSIECSVITTDAAIRVPRPMPYELHYSSAWHDRVLRDEVAYAAPRFDPDLPAHLFCVAHRGVRLFGAPIGDTFGDVAWEDFLEAIVGDCRDILADETLLECPYYGVLNICRIFQALEGGRRYPFSKDEGGRWGLASLPPAYRPLIERALEVYHAASPVDEQNRATGGVCWDREALLSLRDYARERLSALYPS